VGSHWFGELGAKVPRRWFIEPNLQPYISKICPKIPTSLLVSRLGDIVALKRRYVQYIDPHHRDDVPCT
jgi:hypothetical protein